MRVRRPPAGRSLPEVVEQAIAMAAAFRARHRRLRRRCQTTPSACRPASERCSTCSPWVNPAPRLPSLFIGRGTVRTHVSNILAKLGASTRTEAAMIARDRAGPRERFLCVCHLAEAQDISISQNLPPHFCPMSDVPACPRRHHRRVPIDPITRPGTRETMKGGDGGSSNGGRLG